MSTALLKNGLEVKLIRAYDDDLPVLAELNRLAYMPETASQLAFKHWPDEANMLAFFLGRLKDRLSHADTQVYKAVETATDETVGFVCWTLEHERKDKVGGKDTSITPTAAMINQIPSYLNIEYVMATGTDIESMRCHMTAPKYYYLSTFVVTPKRQSMGIGSFMLRHCLGIADRECLPTWLISFPGSHNLYLRFGFKDIDHRDHDLNAYDGFKYRGYGIYRSYAMLREPQLAQSDTAQQ